MRATSVADYFVYSEEKEQNRLAAEKLPDYDAMLSAEDKKELVQKLKAEMLDAVKKLEFERAANLRDQIARIES